MKFILVTLLFQIQVWADSPSEGGSRAQARQLVQEFDERALVEVIPVSSQRREVRDFKTWYAKNKDYYMSRSIARKSYNEAKRMQGLIDRAGVFSFSRGVQGLYFFYPKTILAMAKDGILNQHQTGKTDSAAYDPDQRLHIENQVINLGSYRKGKKDKKNFLRPKMLVLDVSSKNDYLKEVSQRQGLNNGTQYGSIIAVAKERVLDRMTWSSGDSFGFGVNGMPSYSMSQRMSRLLSDRPAGYIEGQLWGEFDLRDIQAFWVPHDISEKHLAQLLWIGLPIYAYSLERRSERSNRYVSRGVLVHPGDPEKIKLLNQPPQGLWQDFYHKNQFVPPSKLADCKDVLRKLKKK